jgi:hypothetical protein
MIMNIRRDETDPADLVSHCAAKIRFLSNCFIGNGRLDYDLELSTRGVSGLAFILEDLEEELDLISSKLDVGTGEKLQDSIQNARDKDKI